MDVYSVADVSKMLNVNEETIRRWIRDGKLKAIRAVGRGGNTLFLEDVVDFANKPPRAYLIFLEEWLNSEGIAYERIEDLEHSDRTKALGAATLGAGAATAVSAATTALAPAALSVAGMASAAAMAGPIGIGVAGIAYGAAKLAKRKNQRTYSIRLVQKEKSESDNAKSVLNKDATIKNNINEGNSVSLSDTISKIQEQTKEKPIEGIVIKDGAAEGVMEANSMLDQIAQAKQMLDAGIITADEFAEIKTKLIARI